MNAIAERLRQAAKWRFADDFAADAKARMSEGATEIERLQAANSELEKRLKLEFPTLSFEEGERLNAEIEKLRERLDESEEVEAEIERLREAYNIQPNLSKEQIAQLTTGFGCIMAPVDVFQLGWRSAMSAARRALEREHDPPRAP